LGISNCYDLATLRNLHSAAVLKPSFLQNRFYSDSQYDRHIRTFCFENGIRYQSFWTLTANPKILGSPTVQRLAAKYTRTAEQIFFAFVQSQGIIPITGTSSSEHMIQDLEASLITLAADEISEIDELLC